MQLPTEDRFLMTVSELKNRIAVLLGGRAAEEVIYGEVSTGAQDDLRKATDIAKSMVKAYGMSEKLGQVSLERDRQSVFLQTGPSQTPGDYSEHTSREIDCEVRLLIDEQYERARTLITSQEAMNMYQMENCRCLGSIEDVPSWYGSDLILMIAGLLLPDHESAELVNGEAG